MEVSDGKELSGTLVHSTVLINKCHHTKHSIPLIHHPYACQCYIWQQHLVSQTELYLWEKLLYSHMKAIGMMEVAIITVG